MIANMSHGGKIAMLGLPAEEFAVDFATIVTSMITIKGIYGREMYETWYAMSVLLEKGPRPLPGDHRPLLLPRLRRGLRHRRRGQAARSSWTGPPEPATPAPREPSRRQRTSGAPMFDSPRRLPRDPGRDPRGRAATSPSGSSPPRSAPGSRSRAARRGPQLLRQQLPRPGRPPRGGRRRPGRRWTAGATAWRRSASSAAPRRCTRSWRRGCRTSSARRTRSCTARASTPTAACSRRCSATDDAVISDELNHASIIDGIRLCKARRLRYANRDMADLEARLKESRRRPAPADRHRRRLLHGRLRRAAATRSATWPSGTTPWSWSTTPTPSASSATHGRGTPELHGVMDRVDIITGTLGKALGGASGGYVRGAQGDLRAAPPALAPLPVLQLPRPGDRRRVAARPRPDQRLQTRPGTRLRANTERFRTGMTEAGFDILPGSRADDDRKPRRAGPLPRSRGDRRRVGAGAAGRRARDRRRHGRKFHGQPAAADALAVELRARSRCWSRWSCCRRPPCGSRC